MKKYACVFDGAHTYAYTSAMDMRRLVQAILDARGWNQAELGERLGVTQVTVSRWLAGADPRGQRRDQLRDLAMESGIIVERSTSESHSVRVMGHIGAGAHIEPDYEHVPPDGLYEIELPFVTEEDMIGFQVEGQAMRPFYDDGDVVVVREQPRQSVTKLVGEEAAVCTTDGKRYIKHIVPGSKPGLFTLVSANADPIIDVGLRWASEIVAHVPARQTRKVENDN